MIDFRKEEPIGPDVIITGTQETPSGYAKMALILGILSFCCCGIFAGIPAIIIGWLENKNIAMGKSSEKGKWMALTGLVLGIISVILSCLYFMWYFLWGGMALMQGTLR